MYLLAFRKIKKAIEIQSPFLLDKIIEKLQSFKTEIIMTLST